MFNLFDLLYNLIKTLIPNHNEHDYTRDVTKRICLSRKRTIHTFAYLFNCLILLSYWHLIKGTRCMKMNHASFPIYSIHFLRPHRPHATCRTHVKKNGSSTEVFPNALPFLYLRFKHLLCVTNERRKNQCHY